MPRLLTSVKNATEARLALTGGADLIDIKDPARGSLGQADASVIGEIAALVGQQRDLSTALGELAEPGSEPPPANLRFVKWGLSGCANLPGWPDLLIERAAAARRSNPLCLPVAVAYADWSRVDAPEPAEVVNVAAGIGCTVILVDTCIKDGSNLLAWLDVSRLRDMRAQTLAKGLQLALAGGIDFDSLPIILGIEPDWIAVRGAACAGGRDGTLCVDRVARLARIVHASGF